MRRETEGSRKYLQKQENIRSTMEGDTNTANVETVSYKKIVSIFCPSSNCRRGILSSESTELFIQDDTITGHQDIFSDINVRNLYSNVFGKCYLSFLISIFWVEILTFSIELNTNANKHL